MAVTSQISGAFRAADVIMPMLPGSPPFSGQEHVAGRSLPRFSAAIRCHCFSMIVESGNWQETQDCFRQPNASRPVSLRPMIS
jgi:hypothetical protein